MPGPGSIDHLMRWYQRPSGFNIGIGRLLVAMLLGGFLIALIGINYLLPAGNEADSNQTTSSAAELQQEDDPFDRTWKRTDALVASGAVQRTWIWGPADTALNRTEPYAEAPGGQREVRYYDKSRMEINSPDSDPLDPWHVTNGLLVKELVTGQRQLGDDVFEPHSPSTMNVVGDQLPGSSPNYATLQQLLDLPPREDGSIVDEVLSASGMISSEPDLRDQGVSSAHRVSVPGIDHQVASVFWDFLNSSGPIVEDGEEREGLLFQSPFFGTGLPITEAYWTSSTVGGQDRLVLFQAFERRVLTYTPENPPGWQIESGNVGQHYLAWLDEEIDTPEPLPTATTGPTQTPEPPSPTATMQDAAPTEGDSPSYLQLIEVGPGAVDSWMRSIVRDSGDRVWIVAMNNNAQRRGEGPSQLVVYRATSTGIPNGFEIAPNGAIDAEANGDIPFADAAIDGNDRLHIAWLDRGRESQPVLYGIFDLASTSWTLGPEIVDTTGLASFGGNAAQGGLSLALDRDGTPLLAYATGIPKSQILVRTRTANGWGEPAQPVTIDNGFLWHPALALGPEGTWHFAAYDATSRRILSAIRVDGQWQPQKTVAQDVLGPENIDQGPTMLIRPDGVAVVGYLNESSHLRARGHVNGEWRDIPFTGDHHTHAPGIGVYADGRMLLAGHDEGWPPQHLNGVFGDLNGWESWEPLVAIPADGSQVFRWAGAFSTPGDEFVDLVFFDEDTNDDGLMDDQTLYYLAIPDRAS